MVGDSFRGGEFINAILLLDIACLKCNNSVLKNGNKCIGSFYRTRKNRLKKA